MSKAAKALMFFELAATIFSRTWSVNARHEFCHTNPKR
jgi:hypothetical protein